MLGIVDRIMINLNKSESISDKKNFAFKKYFFKKPGSVIWICFLPEKVDSRLMKKYNLVPQKSSVLIYRISDLFLSSSPKTVRRVFQKLKKDFQKECRQKKIKNKEVYFIGLSIGNMPAFYFANRIKSKKLMAVCPTDRLGDGIFSALAAKQRGIKSRAIRRGYTPVRYDKIIQEFNPIKNLKNLPKNVEVYLGRFDKYVPYGGGKRLVKYLKKYNKKVVVKEFNFFGHFLTMMMFGLKNKN